MFDLFKKPRYSKPPKLDFRDGRTFDPLDAADGNPRLMLTADAAHPNPDGSLPVHIDMWNGVTWENCGELLIIAQRVATENLMAALATPEAV